jgi:hypothetical protein
MRLFHPIHLHGHDFWIIGQEVGTYEPGVTALNLVNPPRRDVASLPGNGYLAIAFKNDNPGEPLLLYDKGSSSLICDSGSWLLHCHIAWHASQGLSMQFVESESDIAVSMTNTDTFEDTCTNWQAYVPTELYLQDDSGI